MTFTIHSEALGWTGFGIGTSMNNASLIVAWKGSSNVFVTQQYANNFYPFYSSVIEDTKDHLVLPPNWAKLTFSFKRQLNDPKYPITPSTNYFFAQSDLQVFSPNSANSSFPRHKYTVKIGALDFTLQDTLESTVVYQYSSEFCGPETTSVSTPVVRPALPNSGRRIFAISALAWVLL
jgi:hypothetical protein